MTKKNSLQRSGYDPNKACLEKIKKMGGIPCDIISCSNYPNPIHQICNCAPPFVNGCETPSPNCCKMTGQPLYIANREGGCFCCCAGGTQETKIFISEKKCSPLDAIKRGESVYAPTDCSLRKWAKIPLRFIAYSNAASAIPQIRILFQKNSKETETIIVSARQLLMQPDCKFKEACRLVAGFDKLVSSAGQNLEIVAIHSGIFSPVSVHLATSVCAAKDPAGHLLVLNGVVAGDYALTLGIGEEYLPENHAHLPVVGTSEYTNRYPHLQ
jgi:hypothetical protein